ncbi:helix-turn-helix domain-containing protein [Thiofilum flexile]|uniref:helix-turn-helix domain-containing protein n=1 Tax=Thiofilum flexile TaxID=125627 RepID=UPI0003795B11|nr:helix-turn-helix domain-containing protein [Thiofilum flexile]
MDTELFNDLVQSLKEAKAIAKNEMPASRRFTIEAIDVKGIREKTGLSQQEFAKLIRISARTLQNWEQHRRYPTGPAVALLKIVSVAPEVAIQSLAGN